MDQFCTVVDNNTVEAGRVVDECGLLIRELTQESYSESSGFTIGVNQPLLACGQTLQQLSTAAQTTDDPEMQALAALGAGLAVYNANSALQQSPSQLGGISLSVTFGEQSSSSSSWMRQEREQPGEFSAGKTLSIRVDEGKLDLKRKLSAPRINFAADSVAISNHTSKLWASSSQESSSSFGVNVTIGSGGSLIPMPTIGFGEGEADGREVAISHHNDPVECPGTINVETAGNFSSSRTINAQCCRPILHLSRPPYGYLPEWRAPKAYYLGLSELRIATAGK